MAVTLADIKKLRDITGAGMMDVKKALEEAEGDFEKAKDLLRKRGQAIAAKRSDRDLKQTITNRYPSRIHSTTLRHESKKRWKIPGQDHLQRISSHTLMKNPIRYCTATGHAVRIHR